MVDRVTNQAQQNTALRNLFRITEDLFKANERIASGKRINKPSDDPSGLRDALGLRTSISRISQFGRSIETNRVMVESADGALDDIGIGLIRARELALSTLSGTDTAQTRLFAASEVSNIIDQTLQSANAKVKNQYLFSGTNVRTEPFSVAGSGALYFGNSERFQLEIAENQTVPITLPGSEILVTDLNPRVTGTTLLSNLNGGAGIPAGSFNIADRAGNTATVAVAAGGTLNNVISSINASGTNITASLNSAGTGLVLTDSSTTVVQSFSVTEVGSGTTATALGIQGQQDGTLNGRDLNAVLTNSTLLSDLNGGSGLNLGSINIVNGAASGVLTFSGATTVGDVLSQINASGTNVTASINATGNSLQVLSNSTTTTAVVKEVGTGTTAQDLGIGGGRNVFTALIRLKDALEKDDNFGIIASLDVLSKSLDTVDNARAELGAISRRLDTSESTHEENVVVQTTQLANVEDSDIILEASNVAQLEFALQATLSTSARILQPSLLDFLR